MKKVKKVSLNSRVKDGLESALLFIKQIKNYIYSISLIFIIGAIFGFIFSDKLIFLDAVLREILLKTTDLNGLELILFIFKNNVGVAFFAILFGFLFGIIPIFYALSNGVILGYVFEKLYSSSGISNFWRILPHGIFELPAIIISLALGLNIGLFLFSSNPRKELKNRIISALNVFVFVIVPLLLIAAIIEGLLIFYFK